MRFRIWHFWDSMKGITTTAPRGESRKAFAGMLEPTRLPGLSDAI